MTTVVLPAIRRSELGADRLVLLALAILTILGAVAGSHGMSF